MDNFQTLIEFSPIILIIFLVFLQNKLFVTPEQLEKKHRDILKEMEIRYAPLFTVSELKEQFSEIKLKIDKIYEYFIKN